MENDLNNLKQAKKGRPFGPDKQKLARILKILVENPNGLWLRNIAKRANIHPTTVSNYINTILRSLVEDISLGDEEKPIIRVIKLKPFVIKKLEQGIPLEDVLKFSQIIKNVGKNDKNY